MRTSASRSLAAMAGVGVIAAAFLAIEPARAGAPGAVAPHVATPQAAGPLPDAPRPDPVAVPGTRFTPVHGPVVCRPRTGRNAQLTDTCPAIDSAWSTVSGRGQAQNTPSVASDPTDDRNLVAAWVDYADADARCAAAFSTDGGRRWRQSPVPSGYTNGAFVGAVREYFNATGSPATAWDSRGNAYLACTGYNRGVADISPSDDMSGGIYLFRSIQTSGSSWEYMPTPVVENKNLTGGQAEFSIVDSPSVAVDTRPSSPHRDRIYAAWVYTRPDFTSSVYIARSTDFGRTFSAPVQVGGSSPRCVNQYGLSTDNGTCNLNLGPKVLVDPTGSVHVAWVNRNGEQAGPADNKQQVLVATSRDGGATFAPPVLAGTTYEAPDCNSYQGAGVTLGAPGEPCLPEKSGTTRSVFRVYNYVTGAVDPRTGQIALVYGSYVNPNSKAPGCRPQGLSEQTVLPLYSSVKTAACNNDIMVSYSGDGGRSFTGARTAVEAGRTLTDARAQRSTDQFWPVASFTRDGTLVLLYRDRQYGRATVTGGSDLSLTTIQDGVSRTRRVTTSTNPAPTQLDLGRFHGDNDGLALSGGSAVVLWSDTRQPAHSACPRPTPGTPPRLCRFTVNGVQANTQLVDVATLRVR